MTALALFSLQLYKTASSTFRYLPCMSCEVVYGYLLILPSKQLQQDVVSQVEIQSVWMIEVVVI